MASDSCATSGRQATARDECPLGWKPFRLPRAELNLTGPKPSWNPEGLEFQTYSKASAEMLADVPERSQLSERVREQLVKGKAKYFLEDVCHMSKDKGYWCKLGKAGYNGAQVYRSKSRPDMIYVPVNIYHLDYGVRFPLHPFLNYILASYKVALNQVTPTSMKRVISFIFHCEVLGFPLTLDLFRACFNLQKGSGVKGYWSFCPVNQRVVCYPTKDDLKDHHQYFVLVRVPLKKAHPHVYLPPLWFSEPKKWSILKEKDLQSD